MENSFNAHSNFQTSPNEQTSDYVDYMLDLAGYKLKYRGMPIDKWEGFHICKDAKAIINGNVRNLEAIKKMTKKSEAL